MSTKHTLGPWKVLPEEVDRDYIRVRGTRLGDRYKVANVLTPTGKGVPAREADETRANARLISKAPELLESLQRYVSVIASGGAGDRDLFMAAIREADDAARAVIAAATGGSS